MTEPGEHVFAGAERESTRWQKGAGPRQSALEEAGRAATQVAADGATHALGKA